jgi:hypothetical protein
MAVLAHQIATRVLEAFGLPVKQCLSLKIDFERNSVVVVSATYAAEGEQIDGLCEVLKSVRLEAKER